MKLDYKIALAVLGMFVGLGLATSGTLGLAQSGVGGGQSGVGGGSGVSSTIFCGTTVACAGTTQGGVKLTYGRATLNGGTPATATLTGLPYTSSASYSCVATDDNATTLSPIAVTYSSGSSAVLTGGTASTDVISYICSGT